MDNLFRYYNHIGFHNPYYFLEGSEVNVANNISEILDVKDSNNYLDIASIISLISKGYIIGDKTLIRGVNKVSWMSKLENQKIKHYTNINFRNEVYDTETIGNRLFELLKQEIIEYIHNSKSIGVLLTGGMDSRIVAGVLDSIIKDNDLTGLRVIGLTWGDKNSRDVVYARKIADRLNWDWKHYDITSEDFFNNIFAAAERGSEYSPNHLHAMLKVREEKGLDCILAGSFGDSIGRGEYSGRTVLQLKDVRNGIDNTYGFLYDKYFKKFNNEIDKEVLFYWRNFPQLEQYQQIEQDYQIHYMRRMLNPCLSVINERIPLYQVFTNPNIVRYMWSLDPSIRNNNIYKNLLKRFTTDLSDIPWARTGLLFDEVKGRPLDTYKKTYHSFQYSNIINRQLYEPIKNLVLSENIERLEIFNIDTLKNIFRLMKTPFYKQNITLEQKLTWLASLSLFIDKYGVHNNFDFRIQNSLKERMNSKLIYKQNIVFYIKSIYRPLIMKLKSMK